MQIIARGIACPSQAGTDRQSCAFPGIAALPGGRWLCGVRAACAKGDRDQKVLLTYSDDQGKHWSEPYAPFTPPRLDGRKGTFRTCYVTGLKDGTVIAALSWVDLTHPELPFFNETTEGLIDTQIFLSRSVDGGLTWFAPVHLPAKPFAVPVPLTGPILKLHNGDLACQFELNKHYEDTTPWHHSSVMLISSDGGRTWPTPSICSSDPANRFFYWDQRPNVLADGTVLDTFWTYDNKEAKYLNIHARQSQDHGRTWSALWDTGIPGQPGQPVSTPDGGITLVYVDRTGAPAIRMRKSLDGGKTWPETTQISLYETGGQTQTEKKNAMQDAWSEMAKFSVGLPAATALPDGDILVVFYAGPQTDITSIHWVRVRA